MRAAVSSLLSAPAAQTSMSRPDYQQTLEHHRSLLVLLKPLGKQLKPKAFSRLSDRVNRAVSGLTLTDSSGREREVNVRFLREYAPDQNDWGEFQAHRKLLGLLTFANINSQSELNEICRQHESLKVKYSSTLYDSRCILLGLNPDGTLHRSAQQASSSNLQSPDTLGSPISLSSAPSSLNSPSNHEDFADVPLERSKAPSSSGSSAEQSSSDSSPTEASTSAATSSTGGATTPGSSMRCGDADDALSTCSDTTSAADSTLTSPASTTPPLSLEDAGQVVLTTPSNFKTRALYYRDEDYALQVPASPTSGGSTAGCMLDADVREFISSLFWVLEHKRLERSREKLDRVSLLLAPFERKDFVGLDLESRTNKRRSVGRGTKHLADLTLQAGLASEASAHYAAAIDVLKGANDWLWLGGAYEGLCAASAALLFPNLGKATVTLQRNASLQEKTSPDKYKGHNSIGSSPAVIPTSLPDPRPIELQHCLSPDDISKKYRESITHYSKYLHAAVLETEACFKAARIATAQNKRLQASSFLQNVILINLNLTEEQKIERFLAIADLYHTLGFFRKASFYRRLAGKRHVSAQNPNPDWSRCYQLLLQALPGLRLSLDPNLMMTGEQQGWPALQIQLLQELVAASKRMGSPQVAVRHLTFLLQAMWIHLNPIERRDLSLQLQAAASQCEGAPVPLVLPATGVVLPPANLTSIPFTSCFEPKALAPALRPRKLQAARVEPGPFLFTPPSFGSLDRRDKRSVSSLERGKLDFLWVEGDVCEVGLSVTNPLPFELKVFDMRLLTEGAVFESVPSSLALPAAGGLSLPPGGSLQNSPDPSLSLVSTSSSSSSQHSPHQSLQSPPSTLSSTPASVHQLTLAGIPRDCGELQITGYSTHVLGVKSSCRLKQLPHLGGVPKYTLQVVPSLPQLQVVTSLPKQLMVSALGEANNVVTSGTATIFAGETQECVITLSNCHSSLSVTLLKVSVATKMDQQTQREVFGTWDDKPMEILLPLVPGQSTSFCVHLYGKADFLLGSTQAVSYPGDTMSLSSYTGSTLSHPSSLMGSRVGGGPSSLPSLSQPPLSPSHSLQFSPKPSLGDNKVLEGVLKIQYSGGPGLTAGYCRVASVLLRAEVMPSLQVTRWDVLPAETGSEFYLVLDVVNQAPQEAELHYAPGKSILVEAGEFCRVPVPVPRCPLDKLNKLYEKPEATEQLCSELERVCSEHIADNVALRWVLADGRHGTLKLDGIHCSEQMLDIVRSSPLDWELQVDGTSVGMEEVTCKAGEPISLAVHVRNKLPRALRDLTLALALYQDHQNGVRNYRLETRLAIAGASSVLFDELIEDGSAQHRCTVVFFTPGQYKADIHCTTDPIGSNNPNSINAWKLNPALQFCVSEVS